MADDREVLRELWDGRLPILFSLAPDEVVSMEQPDSIYLMVPRQTYFPIIKEKIERHFVKDVEKELIDEIWLEYEGQPLKWHYPVGLLYDLFAQHSELPWNLTVHFQNYPSDEIMRCGSRDVVEAHYMSTVKEADALKRKSQVINGMQKKDHKQLWMGLLNDKFDQFWMVNRKLMDCTPEDPFKNIPIRLYQPDKPFVQKLVKSFVETEDASGGGEGGGKGGRGRYETLTLRHALSILAPEALDSSHIVVIQGLEPPLETPIHYLSEHLSYPDNFLHVVLKPAS